MDGHHETEQLLAEQLISLSNIDELRIDINAGKNVVLLMQINFNAYGYS